MVRQSYDPAWVASDHSILSMRMPDGFDYKHTNTKYISVGYEVLFIVNALIVQFYQTG